MGLSAVAAAAALVVAVLLQGQFKGATAGEGSSPGGLNREFADARDAITEPREAQYQYIVVGGGAAGCALAATLAEHYKVVLLERGDTPYGNPSIERPEGWSKLLLDDPTQTAVIPVQAFRSADGVNNRRARVLGGGTAVNAGFYSRASAADVRAAGWTPSDVEAAYEWVEGRIVSPASLGLWQTAFKQGLVEAGVTPDNGRTLEHIQGTKVGNSIFDSNGRRHTAADLLSSASTHLLTVLTFATVRRVLFDQTRRATGVEYTDSRGGIHIAHLEDGLQNEVILSAGALGSPQLLLLSGVGDCRHLADFNITCIVDMNAVGENMVDNPINALIVLSPQPVEISLLSVAGITSEGGIIEGASGGNWTWQWPGMGELNILPPTQRTPEIIFMIQSRLRNLSTRIKAQIDQSSFVLSKVYEPISRGSLRLATTDVTQNPFVEFNYFRHPRDIETCIAGVRHLWKLLRAPSFQGFRFTRVTPVMALLYPQLAVGDRTEGAYLPNVRNRTATAEWCRNSVTTVWHFHGGCTRAQVVDENYRVFGVQSLRVVDGSTFTKSPGTNPQATVMMLGRYVGVKMLKDRQRAEKVTSPGN